MAAAARCALGPTQPCDIGHMRALKAGLTRAAASDLVYALKHSCLAEISTDAWPSCRLPTSGTQYSQRRKDTMPEAAHPLHTDDAFGNRSCWRGRTRCGHGPGLIEEDGDVVDEDPDEAQLADAPFFVDEVEDSREGDNPSEAETVAAEPLPWPSAPTDPVQILTHLQALRNRSVASVRQSRQISGSKVELLLGSPNCRLIRLNNSFCNSEKVGGVESAGLVTGKVSAITVRKGSLY